MLQHHKTQISVSIELKSIKYFQQESKMEAVVERIFLDTRVTYSILNCWDADLFFSFVQ